MHLILVIGFGVNSFVARWADDNRARTNLFFFRQCSGTHFCGIRVSVRSRDVSLMQSHAFHRESSPRRGFTFIAATRSAANAPRRTHSLVSVLPWLQHLC